MLRLRPAETHLERTELWQRVVERAAPERQDGDEPEDGARRRAVRHLSARLAGVAGVEALRAAIQAEGPAGE